MQRGKRNLITDVEGLYVGNAEDQVLKSGTTVLVGDAPFVAAVDVMGGAPGTRETDALAPDKLVEGVDALVLSGGSAFGLDAASGVSDALLKQGRGFQVGPATVPIVPAAILFDLLNGGQKDWAENPYRQIGRDALSNAGANFALGSVGAGAGATTSNLKGGLGSASVVLDSGHTVGALVAVNPFGSVVVPNTPNFWAAGFEVDKEFGGMGVSNTYDPLINPSTEKLDAFNAKANTTIAIVATDAVLTKSQAKRMAVAAHDGMARSIVPSHTPFDGDLVFAAATGKKTINDPAFDPMMIGNAAALCLARAIARGVYEATPHADDIQPTWQQKWS